MSLSCSEFCPDPVLCRAPLCSWILGAVLEQVVCVQSWQWLTVLTVISTDVLRSSFMRRCSKRTGMARMSAGCVPPTFPSQELLLGQKPCMFWQTPCALVGMLAGTLKSCALGRWPVGICSSVRGEVSIWSFSGIVGYLLHVYFLLNRVDPEIYTGQTPWLLCAIFHCCFYWVKSGEKEKSCFCSFRFRLTSGLSHLIRWISSYVKHFIF